MKKIIAILMCLFFLAGCSTNMEKKVIKEFKDNVNSSKSYSMAGTLEIINADDKFDYDIAVSYKKGDYYKVVLTNQTSGHEQIILKNKDGVYVVTPSLNKSFKFQSSWPENSSQTYILSSVLNDLIGTEDKKYTEENNYYVLTSSVNYPNNNKLSYQAALDDDYFDLSKVVDGNTTEESSETSSFNDILYPLYIPKDTYLTAKEAINTDNGNRAILTFGGAKDFVLVEEASNTRNEFEVIPIYGEPLMMNGTIGALSGNAIYWTSNNVNSISNSIVTGK